MSDERDIEHESGPEESAPVVRRSRRRSFAPRFGLRSLLIAGILFSAAFAWIGRGLYRARQEDAAIEAIQRAGGIIGLAAAPDSTGPAVLRANEETPASDHMGSPLQRAIGWTKRPEIRFVAIGMGEPDAHQLAAGVAALPTFPEIQGLELAGVAFDDSAIETLGRMPRLESLRLTNTQITGDGLSKLKSPERISAFTLTGETNPDVLSGLPALTRLRDVTVSYRNLSRDDVAAIASLPDLQRLDLIDVTPIGENVYAPLANARSLRFLAIVAADADGFDEGDLMAIRELPDLQELTLDGLTEENLAALEIPSGMRILEIYSGLFPEAAQRFGGMKDIAPEALQRFSAEHPGCEIRWVHGYRQGCYLDGESIYRQSNWK